MATNGSNGAGLSDAVREVVDHASTMARLELRLATDELRRKAARFGIGVGLLAIAAVLVTLVLVIAIAAGIAALSLVMPVWAALLVVAGGLLLVAGVLSAVGVALVRRASPPVPEEALREAKLTTEVLTNGGH